MVASGEDRGKARGMPHSPARVGELYASRQKEWESAVVMSSPGTFET
jgi:hypothetical protein